MLKLPAKATSKNTSAHFAGIKRYFDSLKDD